MKKSTKKSSGLANMVILINMMLMRGGANSSIRAGGSGIADGGVVPDGTPIAINRIIPGGTDVVGMDHANTSLPLKITRNSYFIPLDLPYMLFCPDALDTNYATPLSDAGTLPPGVTCTVGIFQNRAIRFTFVQGAFTDTIDITTQFPVPYPVVLQMIADGDWFQSDSFQQSVGSNFNAMFNAVTLSFGQMSFDGFKGSNAIPLSNAKDPYQQQDGIIVVSRRILINTRRYLGMAMVAAAPNPGDNICVNDFEINLYHSQVDFAGAVVSQYRTKQF
jgi:hypothetical protein